MDPLAPIFYTPGITRILSKIQNQTLFQENKMYKARCLPFCLPFRIINFYLYGEHYNLFLEIFYNNNSTKILINSDYYIHIFVVYTNI